MDFITILLDAGASTTNELSNGYTIFHSTVTRSDGQILELLCHRSRSYDLECRLSDGQTPLLLAISTSRTRRVEKLIALGAACHAVDNKGLNVLHHASLQANVEVLNRLLAEPNKPSLEALTSEGATALSLAASKGHVPFFWQLLESGASTIIRYSDGRSLLRVIAASGLSEMGSMLESKGALGDVNARDKKGWPPLFYAAQNGHHIMAQALIMKGA